MLTFERNHNKFNFRVAGIAIHNGKILLQSTPIHDYWVMPGGRVEFHESTDAALVREMKEELGISVHVDRLSYVNELFYTEKDQNFHELGFYYLMSLPENHEILKRSGEFEGIEGDVDLIFKWVSIEGFMKMKAFPEFIKRDIEEIPNRTTIRHEVTVQ